MSWIIYQVAYVATYVVVFGVGCSIGMLVCYAAYSAGCCCCWERRRRRRLRPESLSQATTEKIPAFEYKEGDPTSECAICIEELKPQELYRILPGCGHRFHASCVDEWLGLSTTCPVCRVAVCTSSAEKVEEMV